MTTTEASSTEAARLIALASAADEARAANESPPASEEATAATGGELAGEDKAVQVDRAARFLTKITAKTANRFLPGLFDEEDKEELSALLQPVLIKHETVILAWIEKWFDEGMLALFVVDKIADGIDLVRDRRAERTEKQHAKKAETSENQSVPTGGFVTVKASAG